MSLYRIHEYDKCAIDCQVSLLCNIYWCPIITLTVVALDPSRFENRFLCFTYRNTFCFRYLDTLFKRDDGGPVRLQDFKDICAAMALTPEGIDASTAFLTNNIERILKTMLPGEGIVTNMYRTLASKVALDSEIIKVSETV